MLPDVDQPWGGDRAYPERMEDGVGVRRVFVALINKECIISMPLNMPRLLPNSDHYSTDMDPLYMGDYMLANDGSPVLEYSMLNYTLVPGDMSTTGGILMDPFEGPYAPYSFEDYWGTVLTVVPMQNLPYFSLRCLCA